MNNLQFIIVLVAFCLGCSSSFNMNRKSGQTVNHTENTITVVQPPESPIEKIEGCIENSELAVCKDALIPDALETGQNQSGVSTENTSIETAMGNGSSGNDTSEPLTNNSDEDLDTKSKLLEQFEYNVQMNLLENTNEIVCSATVTNNSNLPPGSYANWQIKWFKNNVEISEANGLSKISLDDFGIQPADSVNCTMKIALEDEFQVNNSDSLLVNSIPIVSGELDENGLIVTESYGYSLHPIVMVIDLQPFSQPQTSVGLFLAEGTNQTLDIEAEWDEAKGSPGTWLGVWDCSSQTVCTNVLLSDSPDSGEFTLNYKVISENGISDWNSNKLVIKPINHTPKFTQNALIQSKETISQGGSFNGTIEVTDANNDNLTYNCIYCPGNATLDPSTGEFQFTDPNVGEFHYSFEVEVTDGEHVVAQIFSIQIEHTLTVDPIPTQKITTGGTSTSDTIVVVPSFSLPEDDITVVCESNCPPGLTISTSNNTISWDASGQNGTWNAQFKASTDTQNVNFSIEFIGSTASNSRPTLGAISNQTVAAGQLLTVPLSISDSNGDTVDIVCGGSKFSGCPNGFEVDQSAHELRWRPTRGQVGTYTIQIVVRDKGYLANDPDRDFEVTVTDANTSPNIVANQVFYARTGQTTRAFLLYDDLEQDQIEIECITNCDFIDLPGSNQLKFSPSGSHVGTQTISLSVTDGDLS